MITSLNLLLHSWYSNCYRIYFCSQLKQRSELIKAKWDEKVKHVSYEQWALRRITLNAWKKNHLVSCILKHPSWTLFPWFLSPAYSRWAQTPCGTDQLWKDYIILLPSALNLMTVNMQEKDKYSCHVFKNLNIIKLQDSSHTGGVWKNNKRSYITKKHNMLLIANSVSNTHWNSDATVYMVSNSHIPL